MTLTSMSRSGFAGVCVRALLFAGAWYFTLRPTLAEDDAAPESMVSAAELIEKLDSDNIPEARYAASQLGQLGEAAKDAAPKLVAVVKDRKRDPFLRAAAATALGDLGPVAKDIVPDLLPLIYEDDAFHSVAPAVVIALGKIGDESAVTELTKLLNDRPKSYARRAAILALPKLTTNPDDIVPLLGKLAESNVPNDRSAALIALESYGEKAKGAVPSLLRVMEQAEGYDRIAAAKTLWAIDQHKDVVPTLQETMKESRYAASAAETLWGINQSPESLESLQELLLGKSLTESYAAASALGRIGSEPAIEVLKTGAEKADAPARLLAARELVRLDRGAMVLEVLPSLMKDDDKSIQLQAAEILLSAGRQPEAVEVVAAHLRECDEQAALPRGLVNVHEANRDAVVAVFKKYLDGKSAIVRNSVTLSLGSFGKDASSAVPKLVEIMEHDDEPLVRVAAAQSLWQVARPEKVIPMLIDLVNDKELSDEPRGPRNTAITLLGRMGPEAKSALPILEALEPKNDYSRNIQEWAINAIKNGQSMLGTQQP